MNWISDLFLHAVGRISVSISGRIFVGFDWISGRPGVRYSTPHIDQTSDGFNIRSILTLGLKIPKSDFFFTNIYHFFVLFENQAKENLTGSEE